MSIIGTDTWKDAVNDLRKRAAEFMNVYVTVENTTVAPGTAMEAEKNRLLRKGDTIKAAIKRITRLIDETVATANSAINGLGAVPGSVLRDSLGNLGFLPLVPVAVILTSTAAITYWVSDAMKFIAKAREVERLRREGLSPEKAYGLVHGQRISGTIKKALPWIGGSILALLVIRKASRLIEGNHGS